MSPYREGYHRDLDDLKILTQSLADQVGKAIDEAVTSLLDTNVDIAKEVVQGDHDADEMSQKIENLCMQLLALQQPMARDLRQIIGILKIGIDLERIGDLAVDIARVTVQSKKIQMVKLEYIIKIAEIELKMLSQTMAALTNDDADMARQTTKWDDEVDDLYVKSRDCTLQLFHSFIFIAIFSFTIKINS